MTIPLILNPSLYLPKSQTLKIPPTSPFTRRENKVDTPTKQDTNKLTIQQRRDDRLTIRQKAQAIQSDRWLSGTTRCAGLLDMLLLLLLLLSSSSSLLWLSCCRGCSRIPKSVVMVVVVLDDNVVIVLQI